MTGVKDPRESPDSLKGHPIFGAELRASRLESSGQDRLRVEGLKVRRTLISERPRENSVLLALFSVSVMLFTSTLCWQGGPEAYARWAASTSVFSDGDWWRVISGMMIHGDLKHFVSNAVLFCLFAYLLYGYFGPWIFPVATVVLGGLVNLLSLMTYMPSTVRLVGASGMVYLMAGFWLTMYVLIERRRTLARRLLHVIGVGCVVLLPAAVDRAVSHRTHAIGLAVGVVAAVAYFAAARDRIRSHEVIEILEDGRDLPDTADRRQSEYTGKDTDDGVRL